MPGNDEIKIQMVVISQTTFSSALSWKTVYFDSNYTEFVPSSPFDNKWASIQVMDWRRIGDKPLSEPMLTRFIDAHMRH